jgi:dGTPase
MTILAREVAEKAEFEQLAECAAKSAESKGRETAIEPDPYRTDFQRDRDRIIHCKSFRRLAHKTQVFLDPEGDHYRTRLTHTLEVSQISRSIAAALRLNEDLTEAIALGHDLGHTPFGHTGESALDEALRQVSERFPGAPERYEHQLQSLRIVEHLEYEGKGLNLTWEVRDGILGHTGAHAPSTLEGQVVRIADRIAYVNHDVDDSLRAGVIDAAQLPSRAVAILGARNNQRITTMVTDLIGESSDGTSIRMSSGVWDAMMELRQFLFDNVYFSAKAKAEEPKAHRVVRMLFDYYLAHADALPDEFRPKNADELVQRVVDYVAGMTDRYAIRQFEQVFIPNKWLM